MKPTDGGANQVPTISEAGRGELGLQITQRILGPHLLLESRSSRSKKGTVTADMKIKITELKDVFDLLMRHLETTGRSEIVLPWDFYWDIAVEELYDPYAKPNDLDLGQLSEDWEKLREIARGETLPVGYSLTWLAAVLRAVGEQEFW